MNPNSTLINFNYLGVSTVNFIASGGTPHAGYAFLNHDGRQFAMDNVTIWFPTNYFPPVTYTPSTNVVDSDYDGVSDVDEIAEGTDVFNSDSVSQVCLGHWRFDNTNTWIGEGGQLPVAAVNLRGISSPMTNAVLSDSEPSPALLQYRDVETNGHANINCRNGTVRFWFKPDWNSGEVATTNCARLLELGNYSPGSSNSWWGLYLSPDRNQLLFSSASNGASATYLIATNLAWVSNQWNQVVLSYTPTNCCLFLNLQLVASGDGVSFYPDVAQRAASGFRLGSDAAGSNQARGAFDELETFNYPLCMNNVDAAVANAVNISALNAAASLSRNLLGPGNFCTPRYGPWLPYKYPTTTSWLTAPEPTVVNEPLSISGSTLGTYGLVYRTQIGQFCPGYQPIQYATWGLAGANLTWMAYYLPFQTLFSSGTANSQSSDVKITYTPTQVGDEKVIINVSATTAFPAAGLHAPSTSPNPYVLPLAVFPAERLAYWSFDNNSLAGEGGQLPLTATGITLVPSPFGQGISIPPVNNVNLVYSALQEDAFSVTELDGTSASSSGTPNLRRNRGTIRFWFKPNWTSGSGPASAVFLDLTNAGWTLKVSSNGSQIGLFSGGTQLVTAGISWNDSSIWHQIAVTYSQTGTALYVDGVATTGGSPIAFIPYNPLTTFRIGSASNGASSVNGILDELETFNYVLSTASIQSDYALKSSLDANGDGLADVLEFEQNIDPLNPPAQNSIVNPAPTPGDTTPPEIQLLTPINAR